jgi:hypothetical protein
MAANYGGGRAEPRLPAPPTGRWALPGGIANQDGVVLACDFADGELTYSHRPNSHEEYVTAEGGAAFLSGRRPLPVGCRGARRVAARERRTVAPPLPHDLTCCPIRCPTPTAVEDRAKKPGLSGGFPESRRGDSNPRPHHYEGASGALAGSRSPVRSSEVPAGGEIVPNGHAGSVLARTRVVDPGWTHKHSMAVANHAARYDPPRSVTASLCSRHACPTSSGPPGPRSSVCVARANTASALHGRLRPSWIDALTRRLPKA